MNFRIHSLIASSLFVTVLTTSIFAYYPVKEVHAQAGTSEVLGACGVNAALDALTAVAGEALSFLSTSVPTTNRPQQLTTIKYGIQQCLMAILNLTIKVMLAKLKKRLLDRLTDDTISWINGDGGKPKFVTNFGDVLKESADAAVGDTLRASGMGKLCSDKLSLQVQVSLRKQKKFSEGITCTLTGAAKNVSAFADNFNNGSWIGYGQLLEPSNNRWGLQLLAMDALDTKKSQLNEATKLKTQASTGFTPTEFCKAWTLTGVHTTDGIGKVTEIARVSGDVFNGGLRAPENPPSPTERPGNADYYPPDFPQNYTDLAYVCVSGDRVVSTPATTISGATDKAVTSDWNTIANMDDLTPYISAIFDAAVNRVKKAGVKGLLSAKNDLFSDSSKTGYSAGAGGSATDQTVIELKASYAAAMAEASSTSALLKAANDQITTALNQLNALGACQASVLVALNPMGTVFDCPATGTKLTTVSNSYASLNTYASNLADAKKSLSQTTSQVNAATSTMSITTLATLSSLVADARGKIASIAIGVQKIIDATTADATLIANELTTCSNAAKFPGTAYSCPVWP